MECAVYVQEKISRQRTETVMENILSLYSLCLIFTTANSTYYFIVCHFIHLIIKTYKFIDVLTYKQEIMYLQYKKQI